MSKQFYFKQFSLAKVRSLNLSTQFKWQKTFLFQAVQFSPTVLFQTIKFSISTQFKYQNNSILSNLAHIRRQISSIGPYQVLPLQARADLEAMAVKGYSTFPKASVSLETHYQTV